MRYITQIIQTHFMKKYNLKILTVVGTRPEIIRLSEIIKKLDKFFNHKLIFTNQNFSPELSDIFIKELQIKKPDYFFNISNKTVGQFYGDVLINSEKVFKKENPDAIVILGDTNSCVCALIAKRMGIPIFHLEAGNRSFDNNVPEEINRKIADNISDFNLVYTNYAKLNLLSEGFDKRRIFIIGSPLNEVLEKNKSRINSSKILGKLRVKKNKYLLISLHREENIENEKKLNILISSILNLEKIYKMKIIITNHPRFHKKNSKLKSNKNILLCKPFGYFDYIKLQKNAFCTLSDSGTIAEESAIFNFPAICLRDSIERPEALDEGSIILTGVNEENIINSIKMTKKNFRSPNNCPIDYKIKDTSIRVIKLIQGLSNLRNKWLNIDKN